MAFVLAGVTTAAGAVLMAARLNSGSPNYGVGMELQAIAAAVIGGASLAGGRGDVVATLFGALTITIVQNGLNLNAVPTSTQNVVIGAIILLAVGIDMWRRDVAGAVRRLIGAGAPDKS
jgi:ribose transport system permease protein